MLQSESFAKCACQHCGGHIEFPIQGAGQNICCPHCDQPTLLILNKTPPVEVGGGRTARKRIWEVFGMAACVVALGACVYLYFNARRYEQAAAPPDQPIRLSNAAPVVAATNLPLKPKSPADPWHGLKAGKVTLEKSGDGRLVYAVGALKNETARQRLGVKVIFDVLDAHRNKVGSATDYTDVIEPGKEWEFRAMVTDKAAAAAKLISVKEQ